MANQIEFKAGSGISLSANAADKSITIATTDPAPSTSTPLALNRGGTGVTDLTANQIAGIRAATTASNTNRFVTIDDVPDIFNNLPPSPNSIWGIEINELDSNPITCITPTDDLTSRGISGFGERPCMFKDGAVQYYLNPNDFSKKEDGSPADIFTGADGDVMIEIPKMGYFITRVGAKTIIKLTNNPNPNAVDPRFKYYAHSRNAIGDRDKIYVSAFPVRVEGDIDFDNPNSKLRSYFVAGNVIHNTGQHITPKGFRTLAQHSGSNYGIYNFYTHTLLYVMYLMKYQNLNKANTLGWGSSGEAMNNDGLTQGMYYGSPLSISSNKFAGIHHWYFYRNASIQNAIMYMDGILCKSVSTSTSSFLLAWNNFNDLGTGYTTGVTRPHGYSYQYIKQIIGTTETGFIGTLDNAASNTYWCETGILMRYPTGYIMPGVLSFVGTGYGLGFYSLLNFRNNWEIDGTSNNILDTDRYIINSGAFIDSKFSTTRLMYV